MKVRATELQLQDYATNSHKFYRVYISNSSGFTQWGRIGSRGEGTAVTAKHAELKLSEKIGKGYVQVVPWTEFEFRGGWNLEALSQAFNTVIGNNVVAAPVQSTATSAQEQEKEFEKSLRAMASRYNKTEPESELKPQGIEAQLQEALAKAKSGG